MPLALITLGIAASLVILQAGALFGQTVRKAWHQQRDPTALTTSDVQETDKLLSQRPQRADSSLEAVREQEHALQKATTSLLETQRSWLVMLGLIALFEFATVGFQRTPDTPLQP